MPDPPEPDAKAEPLLSPLQAGLDDAEAFKTGGAVMVVEAVAVVPAASVMVTVAVPAGSVLFWATITPFDQLYPYGLVPPEATASADPVLAPAHRIFCTLVIDALTPVAGP